MSENTKQIENTAENGNKSKPLLSVVSLEDLEHLLAWNISKNHTGRWGAIKGIISCTYSFMHEDKNEVIKWVSENYR